MMDDQRPPMPVESLSYSSEQSHRPGIVSRAIVAGGAMLLAIGAGVILYGTMRLNSVRDDLAVTVAIGVSLAILGVEMIVGFFLRHRL